MKKKVLNIYIYFYEFIEWVAVNIFADFILNHFNLLNGFTFFIVLIITIFSKAYCIHTLEQGIRKSTIDDND